MTHTHRWGRNAGKVHATGRTKGDADMAKCIDCGGTTGESLDVVKDGQVILSGVMCGICQGWHVGRTTELEGTFNSLLSDGVSREEANRIIIDLIKPGEDSTQ